MPFASLTRRPRALALSGSVIAAPVGVTSAAAEDEATGVGTTAGATTVLRVNLGDLLDLRVIGEDGGSSNDPDAGEPNGFTRLSPLTVSSEVVPALDEITLPTVESRSTGDEVRKETAIVDLADLSAVPGLLGGTINPATLLAAVDDAGARGQLVTDLADLSVLGSVLGLDSVAALLGGTSTDTAAEATRQLGIDALTVLDLGGLLQLVGLNLADLSPEALLGLVDGLGVLAAVADATGLDLGSIDDLQDVVDGLQGTIDEAQGLLDGVCAGGEDLLGQLGITCGDVAGAVDDIQAALDAAAADLLDALTGVLEVLDGAALLSVDGVGAEVTALATDTVADSAADVQATLGAISVGGVDVGALGLDATVDQALALAGDTADQVNGLLGSIHPALANLVDIGLLEEETAVGGEDGATTADAAFTALRATITPPDLCSMLLDFDPDTSTGTVIDDLGGTVDIDGAVSGVLDELGSTVDCSGGLALGLVDGVAAAVTQPVTVQLGSVSSSAAFGTSPTAAPETPTLPRTGSDTGALWLLAAAALAVVGLGGRRALRHATIASRRP